MTEFNRTSAGYDRLPGAARVPRPPTRAQRIEQGLEIRHTRSEPVMFIGHGSSGTSICAGLIRKYCAVAFGNESQFLIRLARLARGWGDLSNPQVMREVVARMLEERYFERAAFVYDFRPTVDQIVSQVKQPTIEGIYNALFDLMAQHQSTDRWGDKSPEYMEFLPELEQLFPTAQYILVVRDGRDTALSVIPRHFGPNNLISAAEEWRHVARLGMRFLEGIPADRKLVIRYEDMMSDAVGTLRQIMKYLGAEPLDPAMFERVTPLLEQEVKAGNTNKWKQKMSPRDRETFESLAAEELKYYGFELEFDQTRPVSAWRHIWARLHDRFLRLFAPKAFKNNLYRAKLRLRDWLNSSRPQPKDSH